MQKDDESAFIVYGAIKVTLATHMVFLHGKPVHLAKMEYCLSVSYTHLTLPTTERV